MCLPGGESQQPSAQLLSLVDWLCPNEQELQGLTGMATATEGQALQAAESLLARGARGVLVTLEARGSMLLEGDRCAMH